MGKMPHRRMKQQEQDQIGCMWGFIRMFDFRRGGYNRRLLPDKRFGNRVLCGAGFSQNSVRSLKESDYQLDDSDGESRQPMLVADKPSVKKLMEEEMKNRNEADNGDSDLERDTQKRSIKGYQQKRKHFSISSLMELEDHANETDINDVVREIFSWIQQRSVAGVDHENELKDNFNFLTKQQLRFEKQLIQATEVLLHEKLISGMSLRQDEKIHYSREFIDALDTLILHKELFFKLLEDPNSELTKRINNLLNLEQEKRADQKLSEGPHSRKQRLFSRRRVKSQEMVLLNENEASEAPSNNAVLDPRSDTWSTSIAVNSSVPNLKAKSSFSFTEIKRRLKHAMGKDREGVSAKNEMIRQRSRGNQATRPGGETIGRMSPSKNPHLEAEIHPKRLSSPRRSDIGSMEKSDMTFERESDSPSMKKISNSYVEPTGNKSSLMLTDEGDNDKFSNRQNLELARESSSTPDQSSSPIYSPSRRSTCTSPTADLRSFSPRKSLDSKEDSVALELEKNGIAVKDLSGQSSMAALCESEHACSPFSFNGEEDEFSVQMSPDGDVKNLLLQTSQVTAQELDTNESTEPPGSCDLVEYEDTAEVIALVTVTDSDAKIKSEENSTSTQIKLAPNSLASHVTEQHIEDVSSNMDRPSPISVLEHVYLEDEISPPSTKMFRGDIPVTPLQIHFDEDDLTESDRSTTDTKYSDEKDSKKNYVHEILTLSGFSWDTVYMRSLSSDQLLDSSLYDADVDIHSDQPSNEYKLLFDCLNEVLMDSCARYFGGTQLTSFSKHNIRPIPETNENAFQEIWQGVEWHLLPLPPPRSSEQIVAKDLAKDVRWMDLRFDADNIGNEIEELVLDELIEDTVMSCFSEDTDEILRPRPPQQNQMQMMIG